MNQVKCEFCEYVGRPDNVKAHTQSKHQGIRPTCEKCDNNFATKSSLKRHLGNCKGRESENDPMATNPTNSTNENIDMLCYLQVASN